MRILYDEDEFETVTEYRPCSTCNGDLRKCTGACDGMVSVSRRRRPYTEVVAIKDRKRREREDAILTEAEIIKAKRASLTPPPEGIERE